MRTGSWPTDTLGGPHHLGTTRMGQSPSAGVVDSDCKVYGIRNLYIAGGSVFPTSGYAPPTLTVIALSFRLADHLSNSPPPLRKIAVRPHRKQDGRIRAWSTCSSSRLAWETLPSPPCRKSLRTHGKNRDDSAVIFSSSSPVRTVASLSFATNAFLVLTQTGRGNIESGIRQLAQRARKAAIPSSPGRPTIPRHDLRRRQTDVGQCRVTCPTRGRADGQNRRPVGSAWLGTEYWVVGRGI